MKPAPFDYTAPTAMAEVLALLADPERDVKVLAGGQSLIPMLNMRLARPEVLVDITRVPELGVLDVGADGALRIGAAVRQARVAADARVLDAWPLLAGAIERIGHPQIRERGTVCGSLAHHDPAAELPTAAVALGARFEIAGPDGPRVVAAEDFFVGTFMTALEAEELLTAVVFPAHGFTGWAFAEQARRHGDFASIGVAVLLRAEAGVVAEARVVFCGAGSTPVRLREAESRLLATTCDNAALDAAAEAVLAGLEPADDVHASARHRRETAAVLLRRAAKTAWERS